MDNIIDSIEKQLSALHRESCEMLTDCRNLQRLIRESQSPQLSIDTKTQPDITKRDTPPTPSTFGNEIPSDGCKYVVLDNDVNKAWAEFISLYNNIKYGEYTGDILISKSRS